MNLTVIRATDPRPADLNSGFVYEEQVPLSQLGEKPVYEVNPSGVLFRSPEKSNKQRQSEPLQFFSTQQSTNIDIAMEQDEQETLMELKRRTKIENFRKHKEASEHVQMVKQKLPVLLTEDDSDLDADEDFLNRLNELRRQTEDPLLHFEGDTDVDEVYGEDEEEQVEQDEEDEQMVHEEEEQVEQQHDPPKRKEKRKGPTKRSHSSLEQRFEDVWVPSSDEEIDVGDLKQEYDDGAENAPFILPNGRKSRAYKAQPRKWYSEERENPEEQFCRKLCFLNVYQFRRALQTFHISQNRNYDFHRNCNDSIIVVCTNVKCPFYIAPSVIANETTFCIRKANLLHTCPAVAENTKVTGKWVAHQCEDMLRIDIGTPITTIMQNLKKKYGVEISTHMAYRARKQALKVVQGDQRGQYTRIRDYLQAVLDTNPGSRCVVTTKHLPQHPSKNPRFHGLFYCLNACKEGFLNGCRPFIGTLCCNLCSVFVIWPH